LAGGAFWRAPRKALSAKLDQNHGWADYAASGFRPVGAHAVRIDALERLAGAARRAAVGGSGTFVLDPKWARLAGLGEEELPGVLKALGYKRLAGASETEGERWRFPALKPPKPVAGAAGEGAFVGLAELIAEKKRHGGSS
jgi:ATP-dependent RNA helicase SUPV3L1/SUV3